MTCLETITPSADAETVPLSCGGDPLDLGNIPAFLRRTPKPAEPSRAGETLRSTPDNGETP